MKIKEDINKKMIEIKNKKSHEKVEYFVKMKKSVAFFQANSGLENSGVENSSCALGVWLVNGGFFIK